MSPLRILQPVKYVTINSDVVDAKIIDLTGEDTATIQLGQNQFAFSRYSETGEPNTFHLPDPDAAEPESPPIPFKPGAMATPEKPEIIKDASASAITQ